MWKESTDSRHSRYKKILSESDHLYAPAVLLEKNIGWEKIGEDRRSVILTTCAYVLGPAVSAYVLWVLGDAVKKGIKRLYFLARDGYFMYETAKILCGKLSIPVDCRYLCCSRYSVRLPMFHLNMTEALDYICRGGIDVTVDKILNRAGLDECQKEIICSELSRDPDEIIAYSELGSIKRKLESSERFMSFLKKRSEELLPALEGYVKKEGLLEDVKFAFVDSGWVGSMQKVIAQLINHIHHKNGDGRSFEPEGYYWGLYELPADVNPEAYHCYYFSEKSGVTRKIYFSNCLFESIFSAPHGMTLRYEEKNGEFVPVFAKTRDENKRFILKTGNFLKRYVTCLADNLVQKGINADSLFRIDTEKEKRIVGKLLDIFMGKPTYGEAYVYGSLPFSDDVLDINEQETAALLSQDELASNHPWNKIRLMTGLGKGKVKESAWYEGSAVRGRERIGLHLRSYAGYKWLLYAKKEFARRMRKR